MENPLITVFEKGNAVLDRNAPRSDRNNKKDF